MSRHSFTAVAVIGLGLGFIARGTPASELQALESIRAAAAEHVRAQLSPSQTKYFIAAGKLDPRLRLAGCSMPLETFIPTGSNTNAHTTVGVRCSSGAQWTIYVPVSIEVEALVLVLRRPVARGTRLDAADVEVQARRFPGIATKFITDIADLKGRRLRRALAAGEAIPVEALAADVLVERGQQVILIAAAPAFEVRAPGLALSAGTLAQRVRVQNISSRKVVEGTVEGVGVVRVGTH